MTRTILHCDMNNFYASVECFKNPKLKPYPVAVCGEVEERHGIVLAKNYKAKAYGVSTGEAIWQAKQKCPDLVIVPPHYDEYMSFSKAAREIYEHYTDQIEPFGMDECWLDCTGSTGIMGSGEKIANEIRERIKFELGLTISAGVSFNKIFAKLGSDMKKPDAVTVIDENNYREKVWPLPVSDLLYVGPQTTKKLRGMNVTTIGDLANFDPILLQSKFGVNGIKLWRFANGTDHASVKPSDYVDPIKSVGHGATSVVDLETNYDVWLALLDLAQDVGHRLRASELAAKGVQITVKDNELMSRQYQMTLDFPTRSPLELAQAGFALFQQRYQWFKPVRAITIRGINLVSERQPLQLDVFCDYQRRAPGVFKISRARPSVA